jgi:hypothetical protein
MFSNETAELLYSTTVGPFCSKKNSQGVLFHKKFKFSYKKKNSLNRFKYNLLLNKQFIFGSNIHSWNTVKRAKTLALCSLLLGQFVHNALEHNMELFEMFCLLHKSSTNMSAIVESICVCVFVFVVELFRRLLVLQVHSNWFSFPAWWKRSWRQC